MPWQKWFLLHALELHPTEVDEFGEPTFRFRKVILLVGRQNGKSTVMQALTLWRMYADRCSLVLGTAQDLEVAESLWGESVEMAEDTEELKAEIGKVERQPGRKMFRLKSGETYKVKAATRRGGRGLSGELVLLDELNIVLRYDYLPLDEVLEVLRTKPRDTHVVVTGRNAKEELIELADLVTEMTEIKHPFRAGVKAQPGIEF